MYIIQSYFSLSQRQTRSLQLSIFHLNIGECLSETKSEKRSDREKERERERGRALHESLLFFCLFIHLIVFVFASFALLSPAAKTLSVQSFEMCQTRVKYKRSKFLVNFRNYLNRVHIRFTFANI